MITENRAWMVSRKEKSIVSNWYGYLGHDDYDHASVWQQTKEAVALSARPFTQNASARKCSNDDSPFPNPPIYIVQIALAASLVRYSRDVGADEEVRLGPYRFWPA
jgi:hypothetical protein